MKSTDVLSCVAIGLGANALSQSPETGTWIAGLKSAGGELAFGLEISGTSGGLAATILNASERIAVPSVVFRAPKLELNFPLYDATIDAVVSADGRTMSGHWKKRSSADRIAQLEFHAERDESGWPARDRDRAPSTSGFLPAARYALQFASEADPSVLVLEQGATGRVATVLTTTGDYRYLSVDCKPNSGDAGPLYFSCFDGAHAFLLRAKQQPDGTLHGHFWAGDRWHDTWTAKLDPKAALPDPFGLTKAQPNVRLSDCKFPDIEGRPRSLDEEGLSGHPRLVQVFGTWCPNCNDEAPFLGELDRRYRSRGLRIVGLAFEVTGDFERDAKQVALYKQRHAVEYPLLVAGLSDKDEASKTFPLLDKVRAYPTTLFIGKDGRVRAVHQGYAGPATGSEHEKLRLEFERRIEALLAE